MEQRGSHGLSSSTSQLGDWQASCGPAENPTTPITYMICIGSFVIGIGMFLVPIFVPGATQKDAQMASAFFPIFGGFLLLLGLIMVLVPLLSPPIEIHLFEGGVAAKIGNKEQIIRWDDIKKVELFEWYDDRSAPRTINVVVHVHGQRTLKFNSGLQGDSDAIIARLQDRVPDTKYTPFTA